MTRSKKTSLRTLDLAQLQHAQGGFLSIIASTIKNATTTGVDGDSKEYYKVELKDVLVTSY